MGPKQPRAEAELAFTVSDDVSSPMGWPGKWTSRQTGVGQCPGAARGAVCTTPGAVAWWELGSFTSSIEGQAFQVLLRVSYYLKPGI